MAKFNNKDVGSAPVLSTKIKGVAGLISLYIVPIETEGDSTKNGSISWMI